MEKYLNHKNLGKTEVLMSYQRREEYKDLPKVIALVSSTKREVVNNKWSNYVEVSYKNSYNNKGQLVEQYYLMFGTNENLNESGFQQLVTKSGRKVSFKTALKFFNEARKATEFVNFSKI